MMGFDIGCFIPKTHFRHFELSSITILDIFKLDLLRTLAISTLDVFKIGQIKMFSISILDIFKLDLSKCHLSTYQLFLLKKLKHFVHIERVPQNPFLKF